MVQKIIKVSAPAKLILSGEHSVVYGQPALVAAITQRLFVKIQKTKDKTKIITNENPKLAYHALYNVIPQKISLNIAPEINHFQITINSQIPSHRGLGSSAALAVALTKALLLWFGQKLNKKLVNQIAYEIEKKQHGQPSGVDNSASLYGGLILFQKGKIKSLRIPHSPSFILLDSGRASESTGAMVKLVKSRQLKNKKLISTLGQVTKKIISNLNNPASLKLLITQNERLLEELGVVGQKAQEIIKRIEDFGAAAKICGAGGLKKGSGMILVFHQDRKKLLHWLKTQKLSFQETKIDYQGVRIEES